MRKSRIELPIRGFHLDFYGHVNHARYLEFFEEARWAHYEGYLDGEEFKENNWGFVVVNVNIDYRAPAELGDRLVIESQVDEIKNRSVVFNQKALLKGKDQVAAHANVTFVIVDMTRKKALNIKNEYLEELLSR